MRSAREHDDSRLYFIECRGIYKIGISRNVQQRVRNLEIGMQAPVNVLCVGPCVDMEEIGNNARAAERIWHARLARYRLEGEWFSLSARIARCVEAMMGADQLPADGARAKNAWHPPPSLFRVDNQTRNRHGISLT